MPHGHTGESQTSVSIDDYYNVSCLVLICWETSFAAVIRLTAGTGQERQPGKLLATTANAFPTGSILVHTRTQHIATPFDWCSAISICNRATCFGSSSSAPIACRLVVKQLRP